MLANRAKVEMRSHFSSNQVHVAVGLHSRQGLHVHVCACFSGITLSHRIHKHVTLLIAKFANRQYAVQVIMEEADLIQP